MGALLYPGVAWVRLENARKRVSEYASCVCLFRTKSPCIYPVWVMSGVLLRCFMSLETKPLCGRRENEGRCGDRVSEAGAAMACGG